MDVVDVDVVDVRSARDDNHNEGSRGLRNLLISTL